MCSYTKMYRHTQTESYSPTYAHILRHSRKLTFVNMHWKGIYMDRKINQHKCIMTNMLGYIFMYKTSDIFSEPHRLAHLFSCIHIHAHEVTRTQTFQLTFIQECIHYTSIASGDVTGLCDLVRWTFQFSSPKSQVYFLLWATGHWGESLRGRFTSLESFSFFFLQSTCQLTALRSKTTHPDTNLVHEGMIRIQAYILLATLWTSCWFIPHLQSF